MYSIGFKKCEAFHAACEIIIGADFFQLVSGDAEFIYLYIEADMDYIRFFYRTYIFLKCLKSGGLLRAIQVIHLVIDTRVET